MADPLDLLRDALMSALDVDKSYWGKLPPDELRFTLEFATAPDSVHLMGKVKRLLHSDRFLLELLPVGPVPGRFQVLRFPTLDRVFPQHNLFEIGYALADELGLVSAEPDLGIDAYQDPVSQPAAAVVESSLLGSLCWSKGGPPVDRRWALQNTKLEAAWALGCGEGIVVGQPDTGITEHDELPPKMFALENAVDILGNTHTPVDPLSKGMANPGHGTCTASVLASPPEGQIIGAAPAARVMPIRCIDDVKVFNTAPVAVAVAHAVRTGCHVVSMSLGGIAGRALHAAIKQAVEQDVIVVAAAGNCVGLVVWPARYDEVIAVGGTGPDNKPWRGSSRGGSVAISAPAEFVWRAERTSAQAGPSTVSPGQGTSYATALVAGAAAIWLSVHGRDNAIQAARVKGVSLNSLFVAALRATAYRPEGWDEDFGAGILDAHRLVGMSLADIPVMRAESAAMPEHWLSRLLDDEFGPGPADAGFDSTRYQAELSAIAIAQAKIDRQVSLLSTEAKSTGTMPSTRLSRAVGTSSDLRLHRFGRKASSSVSRPPIPTPKPLDLAKIRLTMPAGVVAEAASEVVALEAVREYLESDGRMRMLDQAKRIVAATGASKGQRESIVGAISTLFDEIRTNAQHSATGTLGLEALVALKGRPALRVHDGDVDEADPRADDWGTRIYLMKANSRFAERVGAVGRIDIDGIHVGTGFVIGPNLVLTNRHVVQSIAYPVPRKNNPAKWLLQPGDCFIDFAETPTAITVQSKFRIEAVERVGEQHIDFDVIDLRKIDAAVVRISPKSQSGNIDAPAPLTVSRSVSLMDEGKDIAVIGYPAAPGNLPRKSDGEVDYEILERLQALFAMDYGSKFFSPGRIQSGLVYSSASIPYTKGHDCTTLGGSSGSLTASMGLPMAAVGLHFGGAWRTENYAHGLAELKSLNFFAGLNINWVN